MNEFNEKEKSIEKKIKRRKKISTVLTVIMIILWLIVIQILIYLYNSANFTSAAKPIIYIYPEKQQEVTIKLGNPENLSCSYPRYDTSWSVLAEPDGKLIDLKTGKKLYSLYWEGRDYQNTEIEEGFCVRGEDSAEFLEEKLDILGLNYKEKEEFIIYWLPKLEKNNYNLIRFETLDEINSYMPLEINPTPDTLIRIMMKFEGRKEYKDIPQQKLEKIERKGFTVVEWGGTEIK